MKPWPRTRGHASRMPRSPRTPEEASRKNAERWNDRQRARLPLFMDAGLEEDLLRTGVLRDRHPDHQVRLNTELRDRLAALDVQAAARGEQLRRAMKRECPDAYPDALRQLRRLRALAPSLRRAMHTSDHWLGALRKTLTHEAYLDVLDGVWPEHARTLRQLAEIDARIQRKTARGQINPWRPVIEASEGGGREDGVLPGTDGDLDPEGGEAEPYGRPRSDHRVPDQEEGQVEGDRPVPDGLLTPGRAQHDEAERRARVDPRPVIRRAPGAFVHTGSVTSAG